MLDVFIFPKFHVGLLAPTDSPKSKPTPLYGQPSWWGEDEEQDSTKQNRGGKMPEDDTSGWFGRRIGSTNRSTSDGRPQR
ncbi:hypothetical protein ILYODFUR_032169 [Ilyodon furcidens]|uniref:Uncharacterized protein n=1 Tax=Ilyodon furcidens TaxID=33524 RepID=A0ABV0T1Z7_9TELE